MEEEVVVVVKVKAVMLADLVEQELDTHQELLEMFQVGVRLNHHRSLVNHPRSLLSPERRAVLKMENYQRSSRQQPN